MADVSEAYEKLKGRVHRTPLLFSRTFSNMSGCDIYLKLENLQKTGSFKVRGALSKIIRLSAEKRVNGVVAASAGNHAQGVALAANEAGTSAIIVMPETAPEAKVRATEAYGAEVVLYGRHFDESYEKAVELAESRGASLVHAFDDPDVIAGQGTIGLELIEQLPDVEAVIVPVGGGGLASGIGVAIKNVRPHVRVIGVQPETANSVYLSWRTGAFHSVTAPRSVADGLIVKQPGRLTLELMRKYVDDMVTVSESEILNAMFYFLERAKLLVEGAGAVTLAAMLSGKTGLNGRKTVLIVSGGNVDLRKWTRFAAPAAAGSPR